MKNTFLALMPKRVLKVNLKRIFYFIFSYSWILFLHLKCNRLIKFKQNRKNVWLGSRLSPHLPHACKSIHQCEISKTIRERSDGDHKKEKFQFRDSVAVEPSILVGENWKEAGFLFGVAFCFILCKTI